LFKIFGLHPLRPIGVPRIECPGRFLIITRGALEIDFLSKEYLARIRVFRIKLFRILSRKEFRTVTVGAVEGEV